ncbi:hypothetical protein L6R52_10585 [Myxococcota bacterium]|nr:hypothetical protein [Myxococcota bacterium]
MVAPNPFAPPESDVLVPPSADVFGAPSGQYRVGDVLVHRHGAKFADRCVRCGVPVGPERLVRPLYWHPTWIYFLLIPGVLIYVIVAAVFRKTSTVHVGLCDEHRSSRRNAMIGAWLGAIASMGACTLTSDEYPAAILFAVVGVIVAAILGIVGSRVVYATKIDEYYTHLRGVSSRYLDHLPPWGGR